MIDNYTREANERCFKLAQSDVDEVFRDIAATDAADADADRWKKKLNRIAAEYVFSARFALIRLLDGNAAQMNAQDAAQMDAQGLSMNWKIGSCPAPGTRRLRAGRRSTRRRAGI